MMRYVIAVAALIIGACAGYVVREEQDQETMASVAMAVLYHPRPQPVKGFIEYHDDIPNTHRYGFYFEDRRLCVISISTIEPMTDAHMECEP